MLHVAQSAKVIINNRPTTTTGNRRVYLARLEPGANYRFRIQVENGSQVVQREIMLQAGQTKVFQLKGIELAAR